MQRKELTRALLRIAPDITAQDRTECAKKFKISKVTICYYLNGKVANNDRALAMIQFFTERIESRSKKIKELCR